MKAGPLVYPRFAGHKHAVGYRAAVQVMLERRQGYNQRQQSRPVAFDEAKQSLLAALPGMLPKGDWRSAGRRALGVSSREG
jgi:hypothetical protein